MILPRGNIYIVKRIGPNTEPWGTPQVNGMLFEFTPFIRTDCFLSERYDLNHWRATSQTPRWDCSLDKRMLWSMASNAALKSRSNRMTHCFSSICLNISSCTEVDAASVLWNFLYNDWNSSYRLLIFMWSCSLSATTRSINLDKKVRIETGLTFLNNSGSKHIFFSNGKRTASLRLLGITPALRDMFVISVMIGTSSSIHNLISCTGMGSRQQDLLLDRDINMRTSSSIAGERDDSLVPMKTFLSSKSEFTTSVPVICSLILWILSVK